METETIEESSEFRHCVLASTQQNPAKIVQRGSFPNIVKTLTEPEDLAAAHTRFITKIAQAKRMMPQNGRRDDGPLDQAERNEEPPD